MPTKPKQTAPKQSARRTIAKKSSRTRAPASLTKNIDENLPTVSKQTAGGVVGATLGGMVAGPIGAIVGGVAGAMVGNASAEGQHPIETAVENVRAATEKPIKHAVKSVSKIVATKAGQLQAAVVKKSNARKASKSSASRKRPTPSTMGK